VLKNALYNRSVGVKMNYFYYTNGLWRVKIKIASNWIFLFYCQKREHVKNIQFILLSFLPPPRAHSKGWGRGESNNFVTHTHTRDTLQFE